MDLDWIRNRIWIGTVFRIKCWIRIRIKWIRIRNTAMLTNFSLIISVAVSGLSRAACPGTCATRSWPRCTRPAGRRRGVRGGWTRYSTPLSTTSPSSSPSPSASSSSSYFSPSPTSGQEQCSGLVFNSFVRIRRSTPLSTDTDQFFLNFLLVDWTSRSILCSFIVTSGKIIRNQYQYQ